MATDPVSSILLAKVLTRAALSFNSA